ncbi:MAG: aminotransferase class III-fold pyridoxal phosphate-dependent enzyme [Actinobacteria bacterium]|nr:aminotransferase class III-fold pyridoxal phosphate-dependent enzyme [Actinomycetota bacterium]
MLTQTNHRETYRFVPSTSTPVSPERVAELLKAEWELFTKQTGKSAQESRRALKSLPLGVTSSFQHWDPYPISIVSAKGAWMTDVDGRVKIEGGYHGSYDPLVVSTKPPLDKIGDPNNPIPYTPNGIVPGEMHVVPYNNADALEQTFKKHASSIACFILEPVLENIGIVLPDEGYLERVRELCDEYNVVLIFDEVKTGLTAGHQGAAQRLGVTPDLITLAKSIGGGLTLAAFGGKKKYMDFVTNGKMAHFGTFNGNPLAMAGVRAADVIFTHDSLVKAEKFNQQALERINAIIEQYQLPAHTVGFGVKGCITWSTEPVRNYRDYKATDFAIAELSWLWSLNRGIMTPPGLDEQWLISLAHGQKEVDILVEDFESFAKALRS